MSFFADEFIEDFFLRKWIEASAVKKANELLDSRQGPEPMARKEAVRMNDDRLGHHLLRGSQGDNVAQGFQPAECLTSQAFFVGLVEVVHA